MSKDKNRSSHNQSRKNHKNGMYKPKRHEYMSTKGLNVKVLANAKASRKFAFEKRMKAKKAAAEKAEK